LPVRLGRQAWTSLASFKPVRLFRFPPIRSPRSRYFEVAGVLGSELVGVNSTELVLRDRSGVTLF